MSTRLSPAAVLLLTFVAPVSAGPESQTMLAAECMDAFDVDMERGEMIYGVWCENAFASDKPLRVRLKSMCALGLLNRVGRDITTAAFREGLKGCDARYPPEMFDE